MLLLLVVCLVRPCSCFTCFVLVCVFPDFFRLVVLLPYLLLVVFACFLLACVFSSYVLARVVTCCFFFACGFLFSF